MRTSFYWGTASCRQIILYLLRENHDEIFHRMRKYKCIVCGYIYDPVEGDPDGGIMPGTPFEEIPDDWVCPVCGVGKEDFEPED